MTRMVLMTDVIVGRIQGRPRLGRMDCVKVALASEGWRWRLWDNARKLGVESPGAYIDD